MKNKKFVQLVNLYLQAKMILETTMKKTNYKKIKLKFNNLTMMKLKIILI